MRIAVLLLLLGVPALFAPALVQAVEGEHCTLCHRESVALSAFHDPAAIGCVGCHLGDPAAEAEAAAHAGLEAFPGRVATVEQTCGQGGCHAELVPLMRHSIMHSVSGMVELTRGVFGQAQPEAGRGLPPRERLAPAGVDGYLRKLCVSCHLGTERTVHGQRLTDRGGGCSACHLLAPAQPMAELRTDPAVPDRRIRTGAHPRLTLAVPDRVCFGCHSRSGRIALNYVGLAELETDDPGHPDVAGQLPDGRLVTRRPPDLHNAAGLACIDCHTVAGVMGTGDAVTRQAEQGDIACQDCHAAALRTRPVADLSRRDLVLASLQRPAGAPEGGVEALAAGRVPVTARRGTPLFHLRLEAGAGAQRLLRSKVTGAVRPVPVTQVGPQHELPGHERLTCEACHATWAPQCDGCHLAYDSVGRQWDHLLGRETAGRWLERRWSVRADPPALGVRADGRIGPFVPGMPVLLDPSAQAVLPGAPVQHLRYARLSPHTTQKAGRDCASCHQSPAALGLVTGQAVHPQHPEWRLPIGWVAADADAPAPGLHAGDRSLDRGERARVQRVGGCLDCHAGSEAFYLDFPAALRRIGDVQRHREAYPEAVRQNPAAPGADRAPKPARD